MYGNRTKAQNTRHAERYRTASCCDALCSQGKDVKALAVCKASGRRCGVFYLYENYLIKEGI